MGGLATFEGAVAVVTGGASGIGRACALAFAREGADVVIADLHEQRTAEVVAEVEAMGRQALGVRCDVTSDADVTALAAATFERFGRVDLLMLNAGAAVMGPPDLIPIEDWHRQFEVNFFGVVRGVNAFVPSMRAQGSGHVVIVSSIAGRYAYSFDTGPYIASKHAAYGYTENLALYLKPQGVEVTAVCPGLVITNLGEHASVRGVDPTAGWMHFPEHMQRAITPEDVAPMVVDAVKARRFIVYTHPEDADLIRERAADVDASIAWQVERYPDPTPPEG